MGAIGSARYRVNRYRLGVLGGWCFSVAGVFRVSLPRVGAAVRDNDLVTLGVTPRQTDLLCTTVRFCEDRVAPESIGRVPCAV